MLFSILYHPRKPQTEPLAHEIAEWLGQNGHETWMDNHWRPEKIREMAGRSEFVLVLGGDGSILKAACMVDPHPTPIIGINMGRVGFLSEAEVSNWKDRLSALLENRYWTEERLMLTASLLRNGIEIGQYHALNDFVISGTQARVVRLQLTVDDADITTYTADSLIAATPTGSTAYAMAAGGPLLPPQLKNFLLIPVAPYLSLDRALVLHQEAIVKVKISTDHRGILTADGQPLTELTYDDQVIIQKHAHLANFARVGEKGYFYKRLLGRLGFER